MCPSGAGQHAPGHDIRGQHGGLAWSCCDFNMFGFTWASDRSCLSTAASSCSRLGVCRQVTYDQSCPGVLLPADVVWSLEGAHLPRNERATLEVAIAIVRPNLAANRSCSVQTWSRLPLTPWVQCTTKLPRYTGAHLPAWTASCVHCTAAISPRTAASPLPFPGARDSAHVPPSEHMIPSLDK